MARNQRSFRSEPYCYSSEAVEDARLQEAVVMPKANNAAVYNLLDGNRWVGRNYAVVYWEYRK
jgi:hypothetical protein